MQWFLLKPRSFTLVEFIMGQSTKISTVMLVQRLGRASDNLKLLANSKFSVKVSVITFLDIMRFDSAKMVFLLSVVLLNFLLNTAGLMMT